MNKYPYIDGLENSVIDMANADFSQAWTRGAIAQIFDAQYRVELQLCINCDPGKIQRWPYTDGLYTPLCGYIPNGNRESIECSYIENLIIQRAVARGKNDWQEADRIRNHLKLFSINVEDCRDSGAKWFHDIDNGWCSPDYLKPLKNISGQGIYPAH